MIVFRKQEFEKFIFDYRRKKSIPEIFFIFKKDSKNTNLTKFSKFYFFKFEIIENLVSNNGNRKKTTKF